MDLDHQQLFPQENSRSPEIENSEQLIHGSRYLMWSLQFLVSLSLISLFISYLTGISLYYSYTYYFSTFFLPLVTRALERKYMFLLCNGLILIFLVGFRGIHDHHLNFDAEIAINVHQHELIDTITTSLLVEDRILETNSNSEDESLVEENIERESDDTNGEIEEFGEIEEEKDERKEESEEDDYVGSGLEDDGDKELVRSSSVTDDELKKKFDEFIRKMKEELRFEANEYQLIAA